MSIRVLHILNNLGSGGVESFLMNLYRSINREKVQFDFLVRSNENGQIVKEIEQLGGNVFFSAPFPRNIVKNYNETDKFLREHNEYKIIHVHANSLMYVKPLQLASKYNIPCRIIHSHNTRSSYSILRVVHSINKRRIEQWATIKLACSEAAGQWMFCNNNFTVINNGIDISNFTFTETARERIREIYRIGNRRVVGHIGRFVLQKNHKFLLEIFAKYQEKCPESVLMLIGDGAELEKIRSYAEQLGILSKVIFVGTVSNVMDYLSAMDVFLFPSLFEGLGIVLIEAQAQGLPCIVSDRVPCEAVINRNCIALSLEDEPSQWVKALMSAERISNISVKLKRFDCKIQAQEMERFYLSASMVDQT